MEDERWQTVYSKCMIKDAVCSGGNCDRCGFSYDEDDRRKKLPLVKLDNGLYGKKVGRRPEV